MYPRLWDEIGHNPKVFLRRVDECALLDAAANPVFLAAYHRVLSNYDTYHSEESRPPGGDALQGDDLVAYFCAEFGFHESFPIYSGGLGILAGDHCKSASDLRLPFAAVGFLYRHGYFSQLIDGEGNQVVKPAGLDVSDFPASPALSGDGQEIRVAVELPGRQVQIKVWQAKVGHVMLYLLDTDLAENSEADRRITYQLYGGDRAGAAVRRCGQ